MYFLSIFSLWHSQHFFSVSFMVTRWPYNIQPIYLDILVSSYKYKNIPLLTHLLNARKTSTPPHNLSFVSIISEAFHGKVNETTWNCLAFSHHSPRIELSPRENDLKHYVLSFPKNSSQPAPYQTHRRKVGSLYKMIVLGYQNLILSQNPRGKRLFILTTFFFSEFWI